MTNSKKFAIIIKRHEEISLCDAAMAQLVEHILGKDEVPGPNPGSSSRQPRRGIFGALVFYGLPQNECGSFFFLSGLSGAFTRRRIGDGHATPSGRAVKLACTIGLAHFKQLKIKAALKMLLVDEFCKPKNNLFSKKLLTNNVIFDKISRLIFGALAQLVRATGS